MIRLTAYNLTKRRNIMINKKQHEGLFADILPELDALIDTLEEFLAAKGVYSSHGGKNDNVTCDFYEEEA